MHPQSTSVRASHPADPELLHRVFFVRQVCLALVVQIVAVALCARFFPPIARLLPSGVAQMQISFALSALFALAGLVLSDSDLPVPLRGLSGLSAALAGAAAVASFVEQTIVLLPGSPQRIAFHLEALSHHGPVSTSISVLLIAIALFLSRSESPLASRAADFTATLLCLLVLIQVWEFCYVLLGVSEATTNTLPSPAALFCLAMLTVTVILRRAEYGIFSIFLGPGIGGRIARTLTPILLLLPFVREAGRARLIHAQLIPPHYATAILASIATIISFGLLLFLVSRINSMETEIQELTLRDELTGLYNVRGFNLLAGQSLRLAQRAHLPFAVLFLDVDDLKRINDELGHDVGSALLAETAKLLYSNFRDADVIARVGGDEFLVAGQFSQEGVAASIERLHTGAAARSAEVALGFPLSLSVGYATSSAFRFASLKDLVARADHAMYENKRRKKEVLPDVVAAAG
jgi:diguanylate cyclase (GGDEF)-like protein